MTNPVGSDLDGDDEPSADDFRLDGESLEDDETLKMHILGVHSIFSKPLGTPKF